MRSCAVQKKENLRGKLFEQIINGNYPAQDVSKMNMKQLENFVFRLVKFTSVRAGAKTNNADKKVMDWDWWPWTSDVLVHKSRTTNSTKEFRGNLKKVVLDCCDFFRDKQQWLPGPQSWINDENFDFTHVKAEKRKATECLEIPPTKKRKTLLPTVKKELPSYEPFISISRLVPETEEPLKPLTQTEFLHLFKLGLNNNEIPKDTQVPNSSKIIRLQNCVHVPFSSDVGQVLIHRENSTVPDHVTERKIERLEWYINKDNAKTIPKLKYEVTYVPNKNSFERHFKFPKRQYHQVLSDVRYQEFIHKICKPLRVVANNEDLLAMKKKLDQFNIKVNVQRLSGKQLKRHVCREARVVIEKKRFVRVPRIVLENKIPKLARVVLENKRKIKQPKQPKIVVKSTNFRKIKQKKCASKRS